jgi:hypothetical protein
MRSTRLGDVRLCFLAQCLKTLGAHLNNSWLTVFNDCGLLDVRQPLPIDRHFGMADMMTELRPLVAHFALCHELLPPNV